MLDKILSFGSKLLTGSGNPIADLATNFLISKALGGDTSDAIKGTMLQQGLGSSGILSGLLGGDKAEQMSGAGKISLPIGPSGLPSVDAAAKAAQSAAMPSAAAKGLASVPGITAAPGTLGIAPFLAEAGVLNPQGKAASLLNSKVGEALLFGLGSVALDKLFSKDEEEPEMMSRPFGGVEGPTRLNIPRRLAEGGYIDGEYFPRRNGGIMPSEGSGQKDDVPAMLMAGEFVLKKDAVRGLGDGDLNKGIQRAYAMQNQLASKGRQGA